MITLKVDACSYDELVANGRQVTKGEYLGFSPYFDDQLVLSPVDGTIECISFDREEQALCISIRPINGQQRAA